MINCHNQLIENALKYIQSGRSILITGESGTGKSTIADRIAEKLPHAARLDYTGSMKAAVSRCAESLGIDPDKTTDLIKAQVVKFSQENDLIIIGDNSTRYSVGIRYWLQTLLEEGAIICLLAIERKALDVFLTLTHLEIEPPTDLDIRELMHREAIALSLQIPPSKFSSLQRAAGTNLMLAKKVVREYALGTLKEIPEHEEYIDILPLLLAVLGGLAILRFVGLGTGDRTLYLIGGVSLAVLYMLKSSFQFLQQKPRRLGK